MALPDLDSSVGHSFGLEVDGVMTPVAQVAGLVVPAGFAVHRDETGSLVTRRIPGRKKQSEITLTRGLTSDRSFETWVAQASSGDPTKARSAVSVVVLDQQGNELRRYSLATCWPTKWEVGSPAGGDGVVERLTLSYSKAEPA